MGRRFDDFVVFLTGFRKLAVMLSLLFVGIIFRVVGLLDGREFVDLLSGTSVAFFGANGVEHITATVKAWLVTKNSKLKSALKDQSDEGGEG